MSASGVVPGTLGYDRALEWKEPPSPDESALCGWSVVRAAGRPAPGWLPLARIGGVRLCLCPPGREADAERVFSEPLIAGKRGAPARGGYVGVDGQVRTGQPYPAPTGLAAVPDAWLAALRDGEMRRARAPIWPGPEAEPAPGVRVAVIDVCFENLDVLRAFDMRRVDGPDGLMPSLLPSLLSSSSSSSCWPGDRVGLAPLSRAPGHGTAMAGIILHEAPGARVGLFQITSIAGAVPAYVGPTEIAVAVAEAVESWRADVVLIAMSDGAWGTPRHLREVLREASRTGRRTRGTPIFCSVGDPAKNHSQAEDSAAIGADDLASQPWVLAVAACDGAGRWQRAAFDYNEAGAPGATYNRFGPSVALTAPGEARLYGGVLAADDSSQAAALAAAAAAVVLQAAPGTTADELRAILGLTADVPDEIDGGRGLAAAVCEGRDRLGHSFKVGYGRVNGAAAALAAADPLAFALFATRRSPDPPAGVKSFAQHLAEAWEATLRAWIDGDSPGATLAADYARVRCALARAALGSLAAGEAVAWLARHARAVGETDDSSWFSPSQDHGALVDRLRYAVDVFERELSDDGEAAAWLERFAMALASSDPAEVGAIFGAVLGRAGRWNSMRFGPIGQDLAGPRWIQTSPDFSLARIGATLGADGAGNDQQGSKKAQNPGTWGGFSRRGGVAGDAAGDDAASVWRKEASG